MSFVDTSPMDTIFGPSSGAGSDKSLAKLTHDTGMGLDMLAGASGIVAAAAFIA